MDTFAASPMPYRHFPSASDSPGDAGRSAKPPVTNTQHNEIKYGVAFPLLMAALPDLDQLALPDLPTKDDTWLEKAPALLRPKYSPPTTRARALEVPQENPTATNSSIVFSRVPPAIVPRATHATSSVLPLLRDPANQSPHQQMKPPAASGPITPLAAMFRALHPVRLSADERPEDKAPLRNLFTLL
jgi:hypothetical protein